MKTMKALQNLQEKIEFKEVITFPWAGILEEITTRVKESYICVVCRKSMLLTAREICKEKSADGIVTGESLGQKASQTIENISAISGDIDIPVMRPLVGMNKEEIINLSKKKSIFRTEHAGSCPAAPTNPKTKAKPEEGDKELEKIKLGEYIKENKDMVLNLENSNKDISKYFSKLEKKF